MLLVRGDEDDKVLLGVEETEEELVFDLDNVFDLLLLRVEETEEELIFDVDNVLDRLLL